MPYGNRPRFVLFGDSLTAWGFDESTEGFGWFLKEKYQGKIEIENEGYPCYTSELIKGNFRTLIDRLTRADAPPTLLFTIFLGANDACLVGKSEICSLPKFEANIREFVETILIEDHLPRAKIILITPPPINIPDPKPKSDDQNLDLGPSVSAATAAAKPDPKEGRAYRTYMSKKRYADRIIEIANEYEETGRVVGLNFWKALIDAGLEDVNRLGDEDAYDEDRLPGCGLKWAKAFKKDYFVDGLHLDRLGYNVLSKSLMEIMLQKWPELAPDKIRG